MGKKKLLKEIEELKQRNQSLRTQFNEYKNKQTNKQLDNILNLAKQIDESANLTCNYNHGCFGIEIEAILTLQIRNN